MSYAMEEGPRPHRITVDEYHRMAEVGLLAPDARVELIEGVIIDMAPIGPLHAAVVDKLAKRLMAAVGDVAIVRNQGPILLSRNCEPQPDVAVLRLKTGSYSKALPNPSDTLLIIEVSDSSLHFDRNRKLSLYARHGVREVWIADLPNTGFHICRARTDIGYSDIQFVAEPGMLSVPALNQVSVDLSGLFVFE